MGQLVGDRRSALSRGALGPSSSVARSDTAARRHAATLPEDRAILRFRLAAILAAQLFDFATFMIMVKLHGIDAELNPLVASGFESGGFPGLFVAKLALIVLVSSTIVIIGRGAAPRTMGARLAAAVTVIAVCAGVFGGFSNAITI
jgi:hypothetical protein